MPVFLDIVGWLAWVVDAWLAISFAYTCRVYARRGRQFQWATALQATVFWIVAIFFLITPCPKAHIVWILLLAYLHLVALWLVNHRFLPVIVLRMPFPVPLLLWAPLTRFVVSLFMHLILLGVRPSTADTKRTSEESRPPTEPVV